MKNKTIILIVILILVFVSACNNNLNMDEPIETELKPLKAEVIEITPDKEYYFRVYRDDTNETLDEFWSNDIPIGLRQASMSKRFYDQNTPNVRLEYYEVKNGRT